MPDELEDPSSAQQILVRPRASDLGSQDMSLAEMRVLAGEVPFEPAFVASSRIAARIWNIRDDGRAQLEVAREVFGDMPLTDRYRDFLDRHENGVIFSEQQLFIAQRLLVENAQAGGGLDVDLSNKQAMEIGMLLIHAHDIADEPHRHIEHGLFTELEMLAFLIQSGAYSHRPALLNTLSRSQLLFVEYARRLPDERLPLDDWAREDSHGFSVEDQLAVGFGFGASTHAFDEESSNHNVVLRGPFLANTTFAWREEDAVALLTADRSWFVEAFRAGVDSNSVRNVAWETTPFLTKPFLRLEDGRVVLVSPRSMVSWLGDGVYYRLLDSAQRRSTRGDDRSHLFTSYFGQLVETYALDLMSSLYPAGKSDARVYGEQPYGRTGGKRTPDIVIDHGDKIVAFEVRSGFLAHRVRTAGEPRDLANDLDRLLFNKVRQLGSRIADLRAGTARVGDADFANAHEIWPVIVTANITMTERLYDWIEDQRPQALKHSGVCSVVVLDIEDLELLAGLIEKGHSPQDMLQERDKTNYRRLEFSRFALEQLGADGRTRARITEEAWERAGQRMSDTFGFAAPTDS